MNLLQDKLDVVQKKRSNLFNWRGQFTPQFVEYLLKQCSKTGDVVLDPFSGSGTLLQEALLNQRGGIGFEINPAAYAMSEFFTWSQWSLETRWQFLNAFETKLNIVTKALNGQKLYVEHTDYRTAYDALLQIGKQLIPILEPQERILGLNLLCLSEKEKKLPLRQGLQKSFAYLKDALLRLPEAEQPLRAHWQDARCVGQIYPQQADLILTSPPYINVFNYHQNYRAFVELFNLDILQIAQSEFGSNRKNRTNRFKTVIQYCLDMEQTLLSCWEALKPNALLVLILGRQSNVNNSAFLNGQMIADIINASNGFEPVEMQERTFSNKFGNDIKEDILIFRKKQRVCTHYNAKHIATQHLERAIPTAPAEMQSLLKDAILSVDMVQTSPLFQTKSLF